MATVCLALFLVLTAAKLVAALVMVRRTRRRGAPSAAVLVLGMGITATEPRTDLMTSATHWLRRPTLAA